MYEALFWCHRVQTFKNHCPCPPGSSLQDSSPRGVTARESSLQHQIMTTHVTCCPAAPESITPSLLPSLPLFISFGSDDVCLPAWKSMISVNICLIMARIDIMISLTSTQHCWDHPALCGPDTLEQRKDTVSRDYTFIFIFWDYTFKIYYVYIYIFKALKKSSAYVYPTACTPLQV